ncbi:MAG: FtsK/SpoIIIE domain-containing protein [Nocardioidaceae bacterium]
MQVTDATRAQATEYLTARLPGEWEAEGRDSERCIVLRHPPSPPAYVGYDPTETTERDVFNVPIGKDKNGKWFCIPLAELAPHTMLSAPTGYAKTSTLQSFIAHVASRGARVLILDPKRRSFTKAFGNVPGITILTDPESQTRGLEAFADEMEWRYQVMERYAALDLEDPYELLEFFTPWFLVIDEKATLTQNFKRVWKAAGGKGTAKQIEDEELILNLARAALMHVVNASQQGNLETFGSSANRDNHTCRIASGPQGGQAWRMMFPGQPRQKTLAKKGRAIIGLGYENLEEIQLRHSTREIARADALVGVEVRNRDEADRNRRIEEATGMSLADLGRPVPDLPGAGQMWTAVPGQRDDRDAVQPYGPFGVLDEAPAPVIAALELTPLSAGEEPPEKQRVRQARDEWVYGLDAAAAFLGMETESFRKARQRAGKNGSGIPGEVRHRNRPAWRKADLREWHAQRPVAGARETTKE